MSSTNEMRAEMGRVGTANAFSLCREEAQGAGFKIPPQCPYLNTLYPELCSLHGEVYNVRNHGASESLSVGRRQATFYSAGEVTELLLRAGFRTLAFRQTIFGDPGAMTGMDPVREGHGEGCFAVVRADK